MSDDPFQIAKIVRESNRLILISKRSQLDDLELLRSSLSKIQLSRERLARGRLELERFRTLGCSAESQRAYRRSRTIVTGFRAMEEKLAGGTEGSRLSRTAAWAGRAVESS